MVKISAVFDWSTRVTDGQTDGRTDGITVAYTRYSYAVARNKTKVMISGEWQKVTQKDVRWPCGVCGNNSIQCTTLWGNKNPFNGLFSRITRVSQYQKCRIILDFNEVKNDVVAVASVGHMQIIYTSLQVQITTPAPHHSIFLQAGCSSWRPTNSVKAPKAKTDA